jgi:signal transduction histidine kinase
VQLKRSYAGDAESATVVRNDVGHVLLNLVGNAFDAVSDRAATESRSGFVPEIEVVTRRTPAGNGRGENVIIEISDNGAGVPAELGKKIFDPFFTTKSPGHGTGLGLSMSYDIITAGHGGLLELVAANGTGARFRVTLPAESPING